MDKINQLKLKMFDHEKSCPRRINHFLKVYSFANIIADTENIDENIKEIIGTASLLHDVGIKTSLEKYNSSAGKYQEKEGPPLAEKILTNLNFREDLISRVCFLIANHHTYDKIDGIDYQILIEADFLVNIYEDELNTEQILSIKNKYFKTATGKKILNLMFLNQ